MKGKGKKGRDSEDECSLLFVDFKSIDVKNCPRISSILERDETEGVGLEDLDSLQLELESLLVSVINRKNLLESEMESLINLQDVKMKEKKSIFKNDSCGKRSKIMEEKANKKFKESSSNMVVNNSNNSGKSHSIRFKSKNIKMQDFEFTDSLSKTTHVPPIRNDIPDKFWSFIEPYCGSIKPDNLKFLEETLKNTEIDNDYLKVPNLGKHYTLKWAQESRWDGKNESSKNSPVSSDKKKGLSPYNSTTPGERAKKPRDCKNDPDKCSFGFLTQKLVSCLIEENLSSTSGDNIDLDFELNGKNGNGSNHLFKSINFGNTTQLEKRIKKELEDQGILDPDIITSHDILPVEDDEILKELIKSQNDLKSLSSKTQSQLKFLINESKKDLSRQAWMEKLKSADLEVMDAYRKILCAKQKKRQPSKKERDFAIKAIKDRELITKQIDALY